mmetsp:Transcript_20530/g.60628  ORF Transcript_20530/g.60628 Transcript_20530/m.60628 type:complete len:443 (-) Transcript_20530:634-1962(-)
MSGAPRRTLRSGPTPPASATAEELPSWPAQRFSKARAAMAWTCALSSSRSSHSTRAVPASAPAVRPSSESSRLDSSAPAWSTTAGSCSCCDGSRRAVRDDTASRLRRRSRTGRAAAAALQRQPPLLQSRSWGCPGARQERRTSTPPVSRSSVDAPSWSRQRFIKMPAAKAAVFESPRSCAALSVPSAKGPAPAAISVGADARSFMAQLKRQLVPADTWPGGAEARSKSKRTAWPPHAAMAAAPRGSQAMCERHHIARRRVSSWRARDEANAWPPDSGLPSADRPSAGAGAARRATNPAGAPSSRQRTWFTGSRWQACMTHPTAASRRSPSAAAQCATRGRRAPITRRWVRLSGVWAQRSKRRAARRTISPSRDPRRGMASLKPPARRTASADSGSLRMALASAPVTATASARFVSPPARRAQRVGSAPASRTTRFTSSLSDA